MKHYFEGELEIYTSGDECLSLSPSNWKPQRNKKKETTRRQAAVIIHTIIHASVKFNKLRRGRVRVKNMIRVADEVSASVYEAFLLPGAQTRKGTNPCTRCTFQKTRTNCSFVVLPLSLNSEGGRHFSCSSKGTTGVRVHPLPRLSTLPQKHFIHRTSYLIP